MKAQGQAAQRSRNPGKRKIKKHSFFVIRPREKRMTKNQIDKP
jgi:hypothetical protein